MVDSRSAVGATVMADSEMEVTMGAACDAAATVATEATVMAD